VLIKRLFIIWILLLFCACGAHFDAYREVDPEFQSYSPNVIAVLPLSNSSLKANAPIKSREVFQEKLSYKGYNLIPLEEVDSKLKELGVDSGNQVELYSPQKYAEILGADTLIYGNVREYNTKYMVAYASVTVSLEFRMVDAASGKVIWKAGDKEYDTNLQHLGVAGAVAAADKEKEAGAIALAETLAYASLKSYIPYIEKVVDKILSSLPDR
jgi:hypothetical protein